MLLILLKSLANKEAPWLLSDHWMKSVYLARILMQLINKTIIKNAKFRKIALYFLYEKTDSSRFSHFWMEIKVAACTSKIHSCSFCTMISSWRWAKQTCLINLSNKWTQHLHQIIPRVSKTSSTAVKMLTATWLAGKISRLMR